MPVDGGEEEEEEEEQEVAFGSEPFTGSLNPGDASPGLGFLLVSFASDPPPCGRGDDPPDITVRVDIGHGEEGKGGNDASFSVSSSFGSGLAADLGNSGLIGPPLARRSWLKTAAKCPLEGNGVQCDNGCRMSRADGKGATVSCEKSLLKLLDIGCWGC